MELERRTIRANGVELSGLAYRPTRNARSACLVLSHGFTASKAGMDLLASYLCGRGWECLTFDFRGHKLGGSAGRLETMSDAVEDLNAAVAEAQQIFLEGISLSEKRAILVGHSMGALVSLAVAAESAGIKAVAAVATGPRPASGFDSPVGKAMLAQRAAYVDGAEPLTLLREMAGLAERVSSLAPRPVLFVAARGDVLVKPETLHDFSRLAGPASEFVEVEGAHQDAPDRARSVIAAWLERLEGI